MRTETVEFCLHGNEYEGELVFRNRGDFLYEYRGPIHLDELSKWFGAGNLRSVSEFLEHKTVYAEFYEAALEAWQQKCADEAEAEQDGDDDLLTLAKRLSEMRA